MPRYEQAIPGAPCWIELIPASIEAVKPFYKSVLNWDFHDVGAEMGHYHLIQVGDDVVGGCMQHDASTMGPAVNYLSLFFATEDVSTSLRKGVELGGEIHVDAMEVPGQGTFGVATDPTGVGYCLWKPSGRQGFDRFGDHGFPAWFELRTRDFDTECAYYSQVLGADLGSEEMEEGMRYHTLDVDGQQHAGIWDISGVLPDEVPAHWAIYFGVNSTDDAVAAAIAAGGQVVSPAQDSPYGRIASIMDPLGVGFTVVQG